MTDQFNGDVALVLQPDGGQIIFTGGQPVMDAGGLENAVNISLFTAFGWWGNALFNNEPDKQIGSDFEIIVKPKAINNAYLRDVEDAALIALQWMINIGVASEIEVNAIYPELNQVNLEILIIKPDGVKIDLNYELNWIAGILNPVTAEVK